MEVGRSWKHCMRSGSLSVRRHALLFDALSINLDFTSMSE